MLRLYTRRLAISFALCAGLSSCVWLGDLERLHGYPNAAPIKYDFELLCWNIGKGSLGSGPKSFAADLKKIIDGRDPEIVCLQEATADLLPRRDLGVEFGRSFRWCWAKANGVATLASSAPTETPEPSRSWWKEGWVCTPKCTLFSKYRLKCKSGDETELLVVNFHGLNFQWLTYMLACQVDVVRERVDRHVGPVIVCGDFNTWRSDRMKLVQDGLKGFKEVPFPGGKRKTGTCWVYLGFGSRSLPLDHVFYRGLTPVGKGEVLDYDSSDHPPLFVRFRCIAPPRAKPAAGLTETSSSDPSPLQNDVSRTSLLRNSLSM